MVGKLVAVRVSNLVVVKVSLVEVRVRVSKVVKVEVLPVLIT